MSYYQPPSSSYPQSYSTYGAPPGPPPPLRHDNHPPPIPYGLNAPPAPNHSSYPGYPPPSGPPSVPSHAGYALSYISPPPSAPYTYQTYPSPQGPPPPPTQSSYSGYPNNNNNNSSNFPPPSLGGLYAGPQAPNQYQYGGYQQTPRPTIIYFLNVPVPAPLGYDAPPVGDVAPGYDPTADFEKVRKATKGFGTDEAALISVLTPLSSLPMASLAAAFKAKTGKLLVDVIDTETSGYFKATLHGLVLGPLWYDVELVREAIQGAGTDELLLTEILADRSAEDIHHLVLGYRQRYGRDLVGDVRGDLSVKTQRMFTMLLSSTRPPDNIPVDYQLVERDVHALYKAGQGKVGTDEIAFCEIIVNRSRPHLTALCEAYARRYKSLTKVVKSEFSGHMRLTLLYILNGSKPKHISEGSGVWRDAKLLEASMKGFGTKDRQLVWRIVRFHWDKPRFEAIKAAYHRKYKKSLESRVAGETSGDYKRVLVGLVKAR